MPTPEYDDNLAPHARAKVIERDRYGDKMLHPADGSYLELLRRKRLIPSAAWYPYAQRFADNALTLAGRNIPSPVVLAGHRMPSIRRKAVRYRPIEGRTLCELIRDGTEPAFHAPYRRALEPQRQ